jgi:hypothetical protein
MYESPSADAVGGVESALIAEEDGGCPDVRTEEVQVKEREYYMRATRWEAAVDEEHGSWIYVSRLPPAIETAAAFGDQQRAENCNFVQGRFKGKLALKQKTKVIRYSTCVKKSKANNLRPALRLITLASIEAERYRSKACWSNQASFGDSKVSGRIPHGVPCTGTT